MRYSAAIPENVNKQVLDHLMRTDGQEDICFALWYPSTGTSRTTAIISEILLPENEERIVNGNAAFTSKYFVRAIGEARKKGAGIALMHSHLGPGWQDMSYTDVMAERGITGAIKGATKFPLVGFTLGTDGSWSARFWIKDQTGKISREWCESVRVVGNKLSLTRFLGNHRVKNRKSQTRTISAWGETVQGSIEQLTVGIVGLGSVGSIVSESLSRLGVANIYLIDFDKIERVNLDRTMHAYPKDIGKFKVDVIKKAIKKSSPVPKVNFQAFNWSVCEDKGFRVALDCDVIFSCVDRPWPRSVLNFIALSHLIPVIDGGIAIERRNDGNGVLRADWRAHSITPTRKCLECLGQYDPGEVQEEREGYYDAPGYVQNLPKDHLLKRNENVFAFSTSVASFEILQFLSLIIPMPGRGYPGAQTYHFVPALLDKDLERCKNTCYPHSLAGKGDSVPIVVTGRHKVAEDIRKS